MAKAASKYISFDTAGNFVSEFEDGFAAPEAPEDGSLKSAVSYALDAIVEAAGTLPDTAAALVGARPGAAHRDPEEKVADVSEHVRSTIGDDFAVDAARTAEKPRALVIASAKNARAFVVPMEQAGLDVVFATVDNRSLDGFARRMLPTYNLGSTTADVDADTLSANIYTVLSAAKACGATLIFLDSAKASLAEDAYFLRHAAKRGLRVFAPATEGTLRTGWVELLPAGVAPGARYGVALRGALGKRAGSGGGRRRGPHPLAPLPQVQALLRQGGDHRARRLLPGLRHPAAPALRRAPGRHGGRRLVRGVERGHARLQPAGLPGLPGEDRRSAREEWP